MIGITVIIVDGPDSCVKFFVRWRNDAGSLGDGLVVCGPLDGQKGANWVLANLHHFVDLIAGRLQGVDHARRAMGLKNMSGYPPHSFFILRLGNGGYLNEGRAAETFTSHPAFAKLNLVLVGPCAGIDINECKCARDGPFSWFRYRRKNVGVENVKADSSGKFYGFSGCYEGGQRYAPPPSFWLIL